VTVITTISRENEGIAVEFAVRRSVDREALRTVLAPDRPYAAYALAQLDEERFQQSEWWVAEGSDGRRGLVMHSASGLGHALFADGATDAVEALLSLHPGPRFTFASLRPPHKRAFDRHFLLGRAQTMIRMKVDRQIFRPPETAAERLAARDIPDINRLYSMEGGPTYYRPAHLEEGVYYGVFQQGRLASIAGTHSVSEAEGVAVVGNVFTHPRYRGKGLARAATGAVTAELLSRCPLVVLTVEEANEPALAVYRRLGYLPHCSLHESPLIRKEPTGLFSAIRRRLAGWRGRGQGAEVVLR
jgi:RimJ/RimL family protein N-acetyltransferase